MISTATLVYAMILAVFMVLCLAPCPCSGVTLGEAMAEITATISSLNLPEFIELSNLDFTGFGLKNSHVYRELFYKVCRTADLTMSEILIVMALCVAVKNKSRILGAMTRFNNHIWYDKIRLFFINHTVQYVSENAKGDRMPVVNIPSSNPTMAMISWIAINARNPTADPLHNLFAAQLKLDDLAQAHQREWEVEFWSNVVKKGSEKYEEGFHEAYYENKAADEYPLMIPGSKTPFRQRVFHSTGYSTLDVAEYFAVMLEKLGVVHDEGDEEDDGDSSSETVAGPVVVVEEKKKEPEPEKKVKISVVTSPTKTTKTSGKKAK